MVWDRGAEAKAIKIKGALFPFKKALRHAPMAAIPVVPVPKAEPNAAKHKAKM